MEPNVCHSMLTLGQVNWMVHQERLISTNYLHCEKSKESWPTGPSSPGSCWPYWMCLSSSQFGEKNIWMMQLSAAALWSVVSQTVFLLMVQNLKTNNLNSLPLAVKVCWPRVTKTICCCNCRCFVSCKTLVINRSTVFPDPPKLYGSLTHVDKLNHVCWRVTVLSESKQSSSYA